MNIDDKIDMVFFIEKYCVVKLPSGETAPVVLNDAGKDFLNRLYEQKRQDVRRICEASKHESVISMATFTITHD